MIWSGSLCTEKYMILVITDNILLIIIINIAYIIQRFNFYNMFHRYQFLHHVFYHN